MRSMTGAPEQVMKLFIEYTMVLACTLAAAVLVAFGEPARADLLVADAASSADELFMSTQVCLREE